MRDSFYITTDKTKMDLRTNDAHSLYEKFGFKQIPEPQTWMLEKNN